MSQDKILRRFEAQLLDLVQGDDRVKWGVT